MNAPTRYCTASSRGMASADQLTGEAPTNMHDFVKLHAAEFSYGTGRPR
jgi:hypothetical protein